MQKKIEVWNVGTVMHSIKVIEFMFIVREKIIRKIGTIHLMSNNRELSKKCSENNEIIVTNPTKIYTLKLNFIEKNTLYSLYRKLSGSFFFTNILSSKIV